MKIACFTIIQHEPAYFPIWLRHYSQNFPPEHIHVLHHLLPDDLQIHEWNEQYRYLKQTYGFSDREIRNDASFDHEWLRLQVMGEQARLLSEYDAVLFSEVDEIIATTAPGGDLARFAADRLDSSDFVVFDGYEVVQKLDEEPPIHWGERLLEQRRYWYNSSTYSKPLLSKIPLNWSWGFHACAECTVPYRYRDPEGVLIHLHKLDFNTCLSRHISNASRRWASHDQHGGQNRIIAEEKLRAWWYRNIDFDTEDAKLVEIPEKYKGIL